MSTCRPLVRVCLNAARGSSRDRRARRSNIRSAGARFAARLRAGGSARRDPAREHRRAARRPGSARRLGCPRRRRAHLCREMRRLPWRQWRGDTGPRLVDPAPFKAGTNQPTIGNYWPYATTVWDYIDRAMPFDAPGFAFPRRGLRADRLPPGSERGHWQTYGREPPKVLPANYRELLMETDWEGRRRSFLASGGRLPVRAVARGTRPGDSGGGRSRRDARRGGDRTMDEGTRRAAVGLLRIECGKLSVPRRRLRALHGKPGTGLPL